MISKKLLLIITTTILVAGPGYALANSVTYTVNKPATITYQLAHQNSDSSPILGARQTAHVAHSLTIPVKLKCFQSTGIVTDNINGHELPASAKQFGALKSCTLKTTQNKLSGDINLTLSTHKISCSHS